MSCSSTNNKNHKDSVTLCLGIMSGTSLDGIDFALTAVGDQRQQQKYSTNSDYSEAAQVELPSSSLCEVVALLGFETVPMPDSLLSSLKVLLQREDGSSPSSRLSSQTPTAGPGRSPTEILSELCRCNTYWSRVVGEEAMKFLRRTLLRSSCFGADDGGDLGSGSNNSRISAVDQFVRSHVLICSHGQTIWHMGSEGTLQIGDGEVLAQTTGCAVVSNFRAADVGQGGTGAPLVPYFDKCLAQQAKEKLLSTPKHLEAILESDVASSCKLESSTLSSSLDFIAFQNIGGIGNVAVIPSQQGIHRNQTSYSSGGADNHQSKNNNSNEIIGFDTGPGNVILNELVSQCSPLWMKSSGDGSSSGANKEHSDEEGDDVGLLSSCDFNGYYSKQGHVDEELLSEWLDMDYFSEPLPKSTGRELFGANFVKELLQRECERKDQSIEDVMVRISPYSHGMEKQPSQRFCDLCRTAVRFTAQTIVDSYRGYIQLSSPDDSSSPCQNSGSSSSSSMPTTTTRRFGVSLVSGGGAHHPLIQEDLNLLGKAISSGQNKTSSKSSYYTGNIIFFSLEEVLRIPIGEVSLVEAANPKGEEVEGTSMISPLFPSSTSGRQGDYCLEHLAAFCDDTNEEKEVLSLVDAKEAVAFACFGFKAWKHLRGKFNGSDSSGSSSSNFDATNVPSVTGAKKPVVLGQISIPSS